MSRASNKCQLNSLLQNISLCFTNSFTQGTVSYVPQVAWVLNDSLKNNILFGAKHDKDFYREVRFVKEY